MLLFISSGHQDFKGFDYDHVMVLNRWLCSSDVFWKYDLTHDSTVLFCCFFNACNIFNHVIIVNLQTHVLWHIMEFPFLLPYCLSIFCILSFPFYLPNSFCLFYGFLSFFLKNCYPLSVLNIHRQAKQPLESCGSQISLWILSLLEEY